MSQVYSAVLEARRRLALRRIYVLAAAAAAALLVLGAVLPLEGTRSAVQVLVPWRGLDSVGALEWIGPPLLALTAVAALVAGRLVRPAVGLLLGAGGAGYLVSFATLAYFLGAEGRSAPPRAGATVLTGASALLLAAGLIGYHRSAAGAQARPPLGALERWTSRALGLGGGGALVAATILPFEHSEGTSYSLLVGSTASESWWALPTVGIGLAAIVLAFATYRDRDRQLVASGALLGLGLEAVLFTVYYLYAGFEHGVDLGIGAPLGVGGARALVMAGLALAPRPHETAAPDVANDTPAQRVRSVGGGRDVTRYLCAAANLDEQYAKDVLRQIVEEEHRAVAPSHGVDLIPVLRHALAARARTNTRDVLLALTLLLVACIVLYRQTWTAVAWACGLLAAAWLLVFADQWVSRYRIMARHLTRGSYDPNFGVDALAPADEERLEAVRRASGGNVGIYSGFRPFIGSGFDQGGWSLALDVARPRDRARPVDGFEISELYDHVTGAVRSLGLDDLAVEDGLYVDGQGIRDDRRFVPDPFARPRGEIDDALLHEYVGASGGGIRHYRCFRLGAWDGELVVSLFFRMERRADLLFIELKQSVLAPLNDVYHSVDRLQPSPLLTQRLGLFVRSAGTMVKQLALALPRLPMRAGHELKRWHERRTARRMIRGVPTFDYGALASVRELAQSRRYQRYFQQVDRDMLEKIVERRVVDAVAGFLAVRNVDVSEFDERRERILDRAVVVPAGRQSASRTEAPVEAVAPSAKSEQSRRIWDVLRGLAKFAGDLVMKLAER